MTGQELIDFIKENHLESYAFNALMYPTDSFGDISIEELTEDDIEIASNNTVKIY